MCLLLDLWDFHKQTAGSIKNRGEIESMQTIKTSQNNFKVFIYDCRWGKIDLKQISNDCAKSAIGKRSAIEKRHKILLFKMYSFHL